MSRNTNVAAMSGTIREPFYQSLPGCQSRYAFTLACVETVKQADGQRTLRTTKVEVVCFGDLADVCARNRGGGSKVTVVGRIERSPGGALNVVANTVEFH